MMACRDTGWSVPFPKFEIDILFKGPDIETQNTSCMQWFIEIIICS